MSRSREFTDNDNIRGELSATPTGCSAYNAQRHPTQIHDRFIYHRRAIFNACCFPTPYLYQTFLFFIDLICRSIRKKHDSPITLFYYNQKKKDLIRSMCRRLIYIYTFNIHKVFEKIRVKVESDRVRHITADAYRGKRLQ